MLTAARRTFHDRHHRRAPARRTPRPGAAPAPPRPPRRPWRGPSRNIPAAGPCSPSCSLADVMDLIDSTVTNVGGPAIRGDLGGGESLLQWLGAGYTLAFAVFLITGARLGDLYGRRRLFLIGAAGFTLASGRLRGGLVPGVARDAARAAGQRSAPLMIPQGFGMLTEVLDEHDMPKAFGLFGPIMGISAVLGPDHRRPAHRGRPARDRVADDLPGQRPAGPRVPGDRRPLHAAHRRRPRRRAGPARHGARGRRRAGAGVPAHRGAGEGLAGVDVRADGRRRPAGRGVRPLRAAPPRGPGAGAGHPDAEPGLHVRYRGGGRVLRGVRRDHAGAVALLAGRRGVHPDPGRACRSCRCRSGWSSGWSRRSPWSGGSAAGSCTSGIVLAAAGLGGMALTAFLQDHPSPWSMVPAVAVVGIGAGMVFGQLFDVILGGVVEAEVGTASGLLNALQQLAFALGIAGVATIFFDVMDAPHLPSSALGVTALVALVPLAVSFVAGLPAPRAGAARDALSGAGAARIPTRRRRPRRSGTGSGRRRGPSPSPGGSPSASARTATRCPRLRRATP